jgi:hypothetical protein
MSDSQPQSRVISNQKQGLGPFIFFYSIIVLSWLFVIFFHFTQFFNDTSPVVSQYLLTGELKEAAQIISSPVLTVLDWIVKLNLFALGASLGTMFLIYNILPSMKSLSWGLLVSSFLFTNIPLLLTVINFFKGSIGSQTNLISVNEFLLLVLLYPLNYAVFFYFFYIVDRFFIKKA